MLVSISIQIVNGLDKIITHEFSSVAFYEKFHKVIALVRIYTYLVL